MTDQILALLLAEREKINRAIEALQGPTKRLGRPPGSSTATVAPESAPSVTASAPPKAKKKVRTFSDEQRQEASERMRLRWANKKAAEAKQARKSKRRQRKDAQ